MRRGNASTEIIGMIAASMLIGLVVWLFVSLADSADRETRPLTTPALFEIELQSRYCSDGQPALWVIRHRESGEQWLFIDGKSAGGVVELGK